MLARRLNLNARDMDPRVERALTEMERRIAERLTVRELAQTAQLSPSRFAHLFRQQTGYTPMRQLFLIRMERARVLLARTTLPVNQIMGRVGYSDPSHFARDFRVHHELGPSEYRQQCYAVNRVSR
jgi:transcriptional regulator GlxA family with amidase domain